MKQKTTWYLALLAFLLLNGSNALAQNTEPAPSKGIFKKKDGSFNDSTSILYAFRKGKAEGYLRYYFSATDNNGELTDYFANAFGGRVKYATGKFHGFQFGVSAAYVFNIGSSDFAQNDSLTNQPNRYEIGLFDVTDLGNKKNMVGIEELYLKYHFRNSHLRVGRHLVNTPFVNLQDGRMRPTSVGGIWFEMNEVKKLRIEGGWLYNTSPRSTAKWYSMANSVGIYPQGVTTLGKRAAYLGNVESKGVFMLGATYLPTSWLKLSVWDLMFENVNNSLLLQADFSYQRKENTTFLAGFQFIRQDAIKDGGNADQTITYADRNTTAMTLGARLGIQYQQLEITANYNRIFDNGRYLMPREWGRDPFYTFLPRERNEGMGDVHAFMGRVAYKLPKQGLSAWVGAGYYLLPDVKNFRLNKYGLPSYTQINAELQYVFKGILKGLTARAMVVAKLNQGEMYREKRYEFNKVNMELYNIIINYNF